MATLDLTTFTEVDPNSKITVTTAKADWSGLVISDSARVYKDMGVAHFAGDYEHLWEAYINSSTTSGAGGVGWGIANDTTLSFNTGIDHHNVALANEGNARFNLQEFVGASGYQDFDGLTLSTLYYCKTKRDEAVGTYGTLYNYVYSDSGRTTLVATQTVVLHEKEDFRYLYAMTGKGTGTSDTLTGYTQNFDIQEGASSSIKTINGLAKSSVKTVNGLAIASVKTVNGLA